MEMQQKALYNSLRQNYLNGCPYSAQQPSWQIEDYRQLSFDELFARLKRLDFNFDKVSFVSFAEKYICPEEFSEELFEDIENPEDQDRGYLVVFELWRRLLPHLPCISIFCDELDYQIFLHDRSEEHSQALQDALANVQEILEDNSDEGLSPSQVFECITSYCANNLEEFLFDYIADQIEDDNVAYASDLCEGFYDYVLDKKWFDLLRAKIIEAGDSEEGLNRMKELLEEPMNMKDKEFLLEMLYLLTQTPHYDLFVKILKKVIPLISQEGEVQDLLCSCQEFLHFSELEHTENQVADLFKKREGKSETLPVVGSQDVDLEKLVKIFTHAR